MNSKEHIAKRAGAGMHPHVLLTIAWSILGLVTLLGATIISFRLTILTIGCFVFECGWDYIRFFVRVTYFNEDEERWTDQTVKTIVSYAKPIFRVWLACLVNQVLWWTCGNERLISKQLTFGWIQDAVILLCVITSFFTKVAQYDYRRNYVKWIMMATAFVVPPLHEPWYVEALGILQVRWLLTAVLFVVQCFEIRRPTCRSSHMADLFLLRICWVVLVHPSFLLFGVGCAIYYIITLFTVAEDPKNSTSPLTEKWGLQKEQNSIDISNPYYSTYKNINGVVIPIDGCNDNNNVLLTSRGPLVLPDFKYSSMESDLTINAYGEQLDTNTNVERDGDVGDVG